MISNLKVKLLLIVLGNTKIWISCPEGYICPAGTMLKNMNENPCLERYYCKKGTINMADAKLCPSGNYSNYY